MRASWPMWTSGQPCSLRGEVLPYKALGNKGRDSCASAAAPSTATGTIRTVAVGGVDGGVSDLFGSHSGLLGSPQPTSVDLCPLDGATRDAL